MSLRRILIVEASRVFQKLLVHHLTSQQPRNFKPSTPQWDIKLASFWHEAEALLSDVVFDVIVLNPTLEDQEYQNVLDRIKIITPDTAIVVITSNNNRLVETSSIHDGVQDVLFKPEITPLLLRKTLLFAISRQQLQISAQEREKLLLNRLADRSSNDKSLSKNIFTEFGKLLSLLERVVGVGRVEISDLAKQLPVSALKNRVKLDSFKGVFWLSFKLPTPSMHNVPIVKESEVGAIRPSHCLVVEDSLVNQKIVVRTLKKMGFEVAVANNGQEALDSMKNEFYPLVLMDVQMPIMDGIEATRCARKELPEMKQPKIIALTASDLEKYRSVYLEAGMDGCICKPVNEAKLSGVLDELYGAVVSATQEAG